MRVLIDYLELPYPPTINHYFGQRGKIRFLTAKGRKFREEVLQIVKENKLDNDVDAPLKLYVAFCPPDRRKRDIDNPLKPLLDALEHADVYTNDVNIVELHVHKLPFNGKDNSNCVIRLVEVE